MESLHSSLERLQTDHVDLLQAHRYDYATPLEETLRAFDDLVRQGKVHYIGVSEWTAEQIGDALRLADEMGFDRIISNQPQYSLIWRVIEAEVVPLSREGGRGADRVVTAGPGRPDRQVPPGPVRPAGGLPGHRPRGRRNELAPARRGARAGAGLRRRCAARRATPRRRSPWPGCCGTRTSAAPSSAPAGPSRSPRTSRRSTSCSSPTSSRRSRRCSSPPRCSTPASRSAPSHPALTRAGSGVQPGASKRELNERTCQRGVGAVLLEDAGIARVCDAPALVRLR